MIGSALSSADIFAFVVCDRQPVVREKFTDILNYAKPCLRQGKLPDCLGARYSNRKDYGGGREDLGGPLLCLVDNKVTVVGLTIFDHFKPEYTSFFTAVFEHVDWIEHIRAKHN